MATTIFLSYCLEWPLHQSHGLNIHYKDHIEVRRIYTYLFWTEHDLMVRKKLICIIILRRESNLF